MKYNILINNGNENLGIDGKSISVQEVVTNVSNDFVSQYISRKNPLYNVDVMDGAQVTLCKGWAELLAEGFSIQLKCGNGVCIRIYPDLHIEGGNISLERAQELIPGTTDITPENAADLVRAAGLTVRAKAEVEIKLTEMMKNTKPDGKIPLELNTIKVVPKILKNANNNSQTVDTSTGNQTQNPGDDIPSGNG